MHLLIEGERMREVAERPMTTSETHIIDMKGKILIPRLAYKKNTLERV